MENRDDISVKNRLKTILKESEINHPFNSNNLVYPKELMVFCVLGNDEQGNVYAEILGDEIQKIIYNNRCCEIIKSIKIDNAEDFSNRIAIYLNRALQENYKIDLTKIIICPVFLHGFLSSEDALEKVKHIFHTVDEDLTSKKISTRWFPFLLLNNSEYERNKQDIRAVKELVMYMWERGRDRYNYNCYPCCVMSDIDENGRMVTIRQQGKTMVMLMVFQNTDCSRTMRMNEILSPVSNNVDKCFYTAKALSICEPIKLLTLYRLKAVHETLLQLDMEKLEERILQGNWNSFFASNNWLELLRKMPHDSQNNILTEAIYSVAPQTVEMGYRNSLENFCKKYYMRFFEESKDALKDIWWKYFWSDYFGRNRFPLKGIHILTENVENIIGKCPFQSVLSSEKMKLRSVAAEYDHKLCGWIYHLPRSFYEYIFQPGGTTITHIHEVKAYCDMVVNMLDKEIENQINLNQRDEVIMNTGGTHVADETEEAKMWVKNLGVSKSKLLEQELMNYQKILYNIFTDRQLQNAEKSALEMLECCNRVVSMNIESREAYMRTKLNQLASLNIKIPMQKIEQSWLFPVNLIGKGKDIEKKIFFMLGSTNNRMCTELHNIEDNDISFKNSIVDDRLEIVRVSNRFDDATIYGDIKEK